MRTLSTTLVAAVLALSFFCPGISLAGMNILTDAKLFRLELELEPAQPVVGTNAVVLTVSDTRSNQKIDDASIEAVPWMTMHGHGSSKKPSIKNMGSGRYQVENVYFTMEGDWDLLITIENKGVKDSAIFSISNVKNK
jgi:hypothetical protein